ncbi:MAG: peptide deformylase [Anaplasma sp.]
MSVLPLVILPDDRLFLCSEEVRKSDFGDELKRLTDDMFDTMYANSGIGLAAVQVGVHKRIFVVEVGKSSTRYPKSASRDDEAVDDYLASSGGPMVIINPQVIDMSKELVGMEEGCLSIPNHRETVKRPERVTMKYLDLNGREHILKAKGLLSRCLQHELDHLNGAVFLGHLSKFKRDMIMEKVRKTRRAN